MSVLKEPVEVGKLKHVIDGTFTLSETTAALRDFEAGHARGKVVMNLFAEHVPA